MVSSYICNQIYLSIYLYLIEKNYILCLILNTKNRIWINLDHETGTSEDKDHNETFDKLKPMLFCGHVVLPLRIQIQIRGYRIRIQDVHKPLMLKTICMTNSKVHNSTFNLK